MSSTALFLILGSVLIHATWNAISKGSAPRTGFFLAANTLGLLILVPFVILYRDVIPQISVQVWGLLVLAGLFQATYYTGLAASYRKGDLSAVYPLIRAIPVVLVPVIGFVLGRNGQIGVVALVGMVIVTAGCLVISRTESQKSSFPYWKVLLPVLIAAVGTTGYSIVDGYGLSLLKIRLGPDVPVPGFTAVYSFLEGGFSSVWLLMIWATEGQLNRKESFGARIKLGRATLAGIGIFLAYTLVLVSMSFVTNVSYVVAFRQLSIPIGTLIGFVMLREAPNKGKMVGSAVVFCGLILVALG